MGIILGEKPLQPHVLTSETNRPVRQKTKQAGAVVIKTTATMADTLMVAC